MEGIDDIHIELHVIYTYISLVTISMEIQKKNQKFNAMVTRHVLHFQSKHGRSIHISTYKCQKQTVS